MKKLGLVLVILALALVFGLTFVGCDNGSTSGAIRIQGTFKDDSGMASLIFSGSSCSMSALGIPIASGTFSVSGNSLKLTVTEVQAPDFLGVDIRVGEVWTLTIIDEDTLYDPDEGDYYRKVR